MIFEIIEIKNEKPRRTLFIGSTFRAYEQEDGYVLLNDESVGYSYYPNETYNEFSTRMLNQQHFLYEK